MKLLVDTIKSSKEILGEKIPCSIEILTPVHIGSGVKLSEGIDFTKTFGSVQIVTQSELMNYLKENSDERDRFINGDYKLESLKSIPDGKRYTLNTKGLREILEFERNGFGKLYIPGSSIKGAIRTILFKKRFNELSLSEKNNILQEIENNKKYRKEWAAEPLAKKLFGDSSNENLMRTIQIFDAEFEKVELEKAVILTLRHQSAATYGWKKMGKNVPSQDNPKDATPLFVEALPIGSLGYSSISLNTFLFNNQTAKNTLKFKENSLNSIKEFAKTINAYSKTKLKNEKEFFEKLTSPKKLDEVISELNKLINVIDNLKEEEFILRISWGSGWKGMTGDYLNEQWLSTFRQKYRLGRQNLPFPKTRRIIFDEDTPKYLTGWVKIKLNQKEPNHKAIVNNDQNSLDPMEALKQKFKVTVSKKK